MNAFVERKWEIPGQISDGPAILRKGPSSRWVRELQRRKKTEELMRPPKSYQIRSHHISQIRSYSSLSRDEGCDMALPAEGTISAAIDFINELPPAQVAERVGLSNDGEISLFWTRGSTFIDAGFSEGRLNSYYARLEDGTEYFGDYPFDDAPPLRELLKGISPVK